MAVSAQVADEGVAASTNVIGQFGVGFYSVFMVADHVTVFSREMGAERGAPPVTVFSRKMGAERGAPRVRSSRRALAVRALLLTPRTLLFAGAKGTRAL